MRGTWCIRGMIVGLERGTMEDAFRGLRRGIRNRRGSGLWLP